MAGKSYRIGLTVIDADTGEGVAGLRVEGWDKDLIFDDLVGAGITDKDGRAELRFDASHFRELFHDRRPDLFFKVHRGESLLASTEESVLWNMAAGDRELVVELAPADGGPFLWTGRQGFRVVGTEAFEDSLRIESNILKSQAPLELRLPTLCITYADMAFANAIGGRQLPYPASADYGPLHFDPAVEILGEAEVERLTWIRGAARVVIGPEETLVEWSAWKTLVIPRLRIGREEPITARLDVRELPVSRHKKYEIRVMQLADGRHVGGIRIEKIHPDWTPEPEDKHYDLWVRVIDGETGESLPEAKISLFRWDDSKVTPFGRGGFGFVEQRFTGGNGAIHDPHREAGPREAVVLNLPGYRATARCFRALPRQRVRFHLRAWPLKAAEVPYSWRPGDTMETMAQLTGHPPEEILRRNRLDPGAALGAGREILLPCYAASYSMDPGDSLAWLAEAFCYEDADELARLNGLRGAKELDGGSPTQLPGWHFFYAREGEPLERIDEMFGLLPGWSRAVGRVHHADARLAYPFETIAVPTQGFAELHPKR